MSITDCITNIFCRGNLLLVIDVQQTLAKHMRNYRGLLEYIDSNKYKYDWVIATVLTLDSTTHEFLHVHGLRYHDFYSKSSDLEFESDYVFEHFSYCLDTMSIMDLTAYESVTIIGNNAFGCVYSIALQLFGNIDKLIIKSEAIDYTTEDQYVTYDNLFKLNFKHMYF